MTQNQQHALTTEELPLGMADYGAGDFLNCNTQHWETPSASNQQAAPHHGMGTQIEQCGNQGLGLTGFGQGDPSNSFASFNSTGSYAENTQNLASYGQIPAPFGEMPSSFEQAPNTYVQPPVTGSENLETYFGNAGLPWAMSTSPNTNSSQANGMVNDFGFAELGAFGSRPQTPFLNDAQFGWVNGAMHGQHAFAQPESSGFGQHQPTQPTSVSLPDHVQSPTVAGFSTIQRTKQNSTPKTLGGKSNNLIKSNNGFGLNPASKDAYCNEAANARTALGTLNKGSKHPITASQLRSGFANSNRQSQVVESPSQTSSPSAEQRKFDRLPPISDFFDLSTLTVKFPASHDQPQGGEPSQKGSGRSKVRAGKQAVTSARVDSGSGAKERDFPTPEGIVPGNDTKLPVWMGYLEFDRDLGRYPRIQHHVLDAEGNVVKGNTGDPLRFIQDPDKNAVLPNQITKADLLNGRNVYYWMASHPLLRQKDLFDRVTDYTPEELHKPGRVNALANVRNRWRAKNGGLDFVPKTVTKDKSTFSKWDLQRVDTLSKEQIERGIIWPIVSDSQNLMFDPFSKCAFEIPNRKPHSPSARVKLLKDRLVYLKDKADSEGLKNWEYAKKEEIINNHRFVVARQNRAAQKQRVAQSMEASMYEKEPEDHDKDADGDSDMGNSQKNGSDGGSADADGEPDIDYAAIVAKAAAALNGPGLQPRGVKRKAVDDEESDEDGGEAPARESGRPRKLAKLSTEEAKILEPEVCEGLLTLGGKLKNAFPQQLEGSFKDGEELKVVLGETFVGR